MLYFYEFSIVLGMLMKICCSFDLSIKKVQIQNWLTETCLFLQMSGIHKEKHSLILMLIPECLACQLFSCYCEVNTSTVSIWKNLARGVLQKHKTRQISQCWWITHHTSKISHSNLPFFKPITHWEKCQADNLNMQVQLLLGQFKQQFLVKDCWTKLSA